MKIRKSDFSELSKALDQLVGKYGSENVLRKALSYQQEEVSDSILTIVCNLGPHPLPHEIVRGELFIASEGNLDFSSHIEVEKSITNVLEGVIKKVSSKQWTSIYLVPFGHVTLAMQIKALCHRILGIETIDWFYLSTVGYFPLKLSTRELIMGSK